MYKNFNESQVNTCVVHVVYHKRRNFGSHNIRSVMFRCCRFVATASSPPPLRHRHRFVTATALSPPFCRCRFVATISSLLFCCHRFVAAVSSPPFRCGYISSPVILSWGHFVASHFVAVHFSACRFVTGTLWCLPFHRRHTSSLEHEEDCEICSSSKRT